MQNLSVRYQKSFRCTASTAIAFLLLSASVSFATTDTSTPTRVIARVGVSCQSVIASMLDFGTLTASPQLLVTQTDATASLTISCTNGAAYSVVANTGSNVNGSQRRMRIGASSAYMLYDIYTTAARSISYPTTGTTQSGTADSTDQTVTVYGRVPAQTVTVYGTFTDTLTFTLTY